MSPAPEPVEKKKREWGRSLDFGGGFPKSVEKLFGHFQPGMVRKAGEWWPPNCCCRIAECQSHQRPLLFVVRHLARGLSSPIISALLPPNPTSPLPRSPLSCLIPWIWPLCSRPTRCPNFWSYSFQIAPALIPPSFPVCPFPLSRLPNFPKFFKMIKKPFQNQTQKNFEIFKK